MNFIDKTEHNKKSSILFHYEINYSKIHIADARIFNPYKNQKFYTLEINIFNNKNYNYYQYILRQCIYKIINILGIKIKQTYLRIIISNKLSIDNQSLIKNILKHEGFKPVNYSQIYEYKLQNIYSKLTKKNKNDTYLKKINSKTQKRNSNRNKKEFRMIDISKDGYDKTYIISSSKINGLLFTKLQEYMSRYGYKEIINADSKPFLLWVGFMEDLKFNKKYFNTSCFLMNILNDSKNIITNKFNLYFNFKESFPNEYLNYMAESWDINKFIENSILKNRISKDNEVFIVKPAGISAFKGKNIFIVDNLKLLNEAIENTKIYKKIIISKYITNPLLEPSLENKKFHIRIYYLVSIINGYIATSIFNFYEILTAEKPYKNADWYNKDIHDTHASDNDVELIFPMDNKDIKLHHKFITIYIPKIKKCLELISKFIHGKIEPYSQAKNAFETFGCDFLITDKDEIILMEINDKIGLAANNIQNTIRFSKLYLSEVITYILAPLLDKNYKEPDWIYYEQINKNKEINNKE